MGKTYKEARKLDAGKASVNREKTLKENKIQEDKIVQKNKKLNYLLIFPSQGNEKEVI